MKYSSENHDAYFIRPSNGHSSPGSKCPESLYIRELRACPLPGHPVSSFMELNGRICRVFLLLDSHTAPTTPSRRGAD
eukprot:467279-Pyramimonas_sp.AAC.1